MITRLLSPKNAALLVVFVLLSGLTACNAYRKMLTYEQNMLKTVARSNMKPEAKMDSLLASAVRVMEVALKPVNPVKGGKIIDQYYRENQGAMEAISREMGSSFKKMNLIEQGRLAVKLARNPSARKFASLYPKFKTKYKQVRAASKFLGFFSRSLGGLGKIADLLG